MTRPRQSPCGRPAEAAALYVTCGRPSSWNVRNSAFWRRAAASRSPAATSTSIPAARSRSRPLPFTLGLGSSAAITTRATPGCDQRVGARRGPPVVAARLEADVGGRPPRRRPQAAAPSPRRAPLPRRSCQPSASTSPSRTSRQPTTGLGAAVRLPRSASSRVRRRNDSSAGVTPRPDRRPRRRCRSARGSSRPELGEPKIADPATRMFAPASNTSRMVSRLTPPSTSTATPSSPLPRA